MEYAHVTVALTHLVLYLVLSICRSAALPAHALSERQASGDALAAFCNCRVTDGSLVDEQCDSDTSYAIPSPFTHTDAFGGSTGAIQTCLSELTEPNKRICYRTQTTLCSDYSLQCLLKKRNPDKDNVIRDRCDNIDDYSTQDQLETMNGRMYIRSPRYECQKKGKNGAWSEPGFYKYRHNDLCLHSASVACANGTVTLKSTLTGSDNPNLQPAVDPSNSQTCVDYVEVIHSGGTERFCGNEPWQSSPRVISSDFTVIFWSAAKDEGPQADGYYTGFELVAECYSSPLE